MKLRIGKIFVYKTRPHWIVFAWAVWLACLATRFFFAANYVGDPNDAQTSLSLAWTLSVITSIAVILAEFYRWSSRFILTDRRVVLKNGILRIRHRSPFAAICSTGRTTVTHSEPGGRTGLI